MRLIIFFLLFPLLAICQPKKDTIPVKMHGRSVIVITMAQVDSSNGTGDTIPIIPVPTGPTTTKLTFSTTLADATTAAAGLYRNGQLLRTFFSNTSLSDGVHNFQYSPVDDNLDTITSLSGTHIEVTRTNAQYNWDGVVGNTSTNNSGETLHAGYNQIQGIAVTTSRVYYNNEYNEFHPTHHYFNKSTPQERTSLFPIGITASQHTIDMCTDGTNVYWVGRDEFAPSRGVTYKYADFVFGTKVSDNTQTSFSSGAPYKLSLGQLYSSVINFNSDSLYPCSGITVQQSGNLLFVAHTSKVDVLNKTTGAFVTSNAIAAKRMAAYGNSYVFVANGTTVKKYSVSVGGVMMLSSTITGFADALALTVNGDTLVVVDGGTSQLVKAYSAATGAAYWTFGTAGGYYKSSLAANNKFYFSDDSTFYGASIAYDTDGSFWLVDAGNCRLLHFNSGRQYLEHIQYIPNSYNVYCDPKDPTRVFVNYMEFTVDYSKPLQYGNGSWTFKANWLNDPLLLRNYTSTYTIRPIKFTNGRTYSLIQDNYGITYSGYWRYQVVELVGDSIRPTGKYFPQACWYLHHDLGMYYMPRKVIGKPMIYAKKVLTGYSGNNPVWSLTDSVLASYNYQANDPYYTGNPRTLRPGEKTSDNKLIVFQGDVGSTGFHLGAIKYGDTSFTWRTARSTHRNYIGNYPADDAFDLGNGSQYTGAVALCLDDLIVWGFHGEFWKASQTNKWNVVAKNGLTVGQFGVVRPDLNTYKPPQMAGNVSSGSLVKVGDTLYLWHNDEGQHSGIHRWSIKNYTTITDTVTPSLTLVTIDTTLTNLMDSLPYNSGLVEGTAGWHRSPTTDILTDPLRDFWKVATSLKSYSVFSNPDIYLDYANKYFQPIGASLYKSFPTINQSTWSLTGQITFDGNTPASDQIKSDTSGSGNIFLDIVDYNNKVLVRLFPKYDPTRTFIDYYVNNQLLWRDSAWTSTLTSKYWQNYSVTSTAGVLAISYAGHSISGLTPLDATANKSRPAKIRVYAWNKNANYNRRLGLKDLVFDK